MLQIFVKLVLEFIPWTSHAGSGGIASLHHEVSDDTMEDGFIVKTFIYQKHEIVNCDWRLFGKKIDSDIAQVSGEN